MEITGFERTILNALLAGAIPELVLLRAQAEVAAVESREMTGVGFFTHLSVSPEVPRLESKGRIVLSDISAEIVGVKHGAGFLLFIQDGQLDNLEGFTYDDPWPDDVELRRWYYLRPVEPGSSQLVEAAERDLAYVASMLTS